MPARFRDQMTAAENAAIELPTVDRSPRFPHDRLLRSHGFRVADRPNGREAVWERRIDGAWTRFDESAALAWVEQQRRQALE